MRRLDGSPDAAVEPLDADRAPYSPEAPPSRRRVQDSRLLSGLSLLVWPWNRLPGIPWLSRRRRGMLKRAVVAHLAYVSHYEDSLTGRPVARGTPGARSVGLSYREIKKRVEEENLGSRVAMMSIRSYARDARLEGVEMPRRRPYSRRHR